MEVEDSVQTKKGKLDEVVVEASEVKGSTINVGLSIQPCESK
jgi:hypothetical protein